MVDKTPLSFPDGFVWGAATSSYQIEGATGEDGRNPSIWDTFCRVPGAIADGSNGDVAADHYHRWRQDVALMADLGIGAYRFSIAWPRIVPDGRGAVNQAGLDFYDRLVDELLKHGIEPFGTLYHWDLPQALEDEGGWTVRSTAQAFSDYAAAVVQRLGDRVHHWATLNEPWVSAELGYFEGIHAPGRRSRPAALAAGHHLLLAHGLAVPEMRAAAPEASIGIVLDFEPKYPASDSPEDAAAARLAHDTMNRWYLDPLAGRGYPAQAAEQLGWDRSVVLDGDMDTIAAPIDFLGVNYYTRQVVTAGAPSAVPGGAATTDMGWEVFPHGLSEILEWIWTEYQIDPLFVTENGAAYTDDPGDPSADPKRVSFLREHLAAAAQSISRGVPLRGYFVWSLLDNFEWGHGYLQRFGITHVDYETLERTPRDSARYWSSVAASNAVDPPGYP